MKTLSLIGAAAVLGVAWFCGAEPKDQSATAAPAKAVPSEPTEETKGVLEVLAEQAAAARPLVKTDAARAFLDATVSLPMPDPATRTVWRNRAKNAAVSQREYDAMPEAEREGFVKRECDAGFYYFTGYGTPLMYARPLDLLAEKVGIRSWSGMKVCDFGYGTVGHLRLLALNGADVTGVDVEPMFPVLYSEPADTGVVRVSAKAEEHPRNGRITLVNGRWPADEAARQRVAAAAGVGPAAPAASGSGAPAQAGTPGFDVFISKNTLKRGYIHPARAVDEKFLVKLGVDDETFVKAVHDTLKPGGWFMIYNLSPKQSPADKPYLPHADGQMPFPREMLEKAGFEVLEYDRDDRDAAVRWWVALGIGEGKTEEETREDLFCWWMVAKRK